MSMQKHLTTVVVTLFAVAQTLTFAQTKGYTPLTTWPYMYEEFQQGWITTFQGNKINYDQINVNLANGRVHYIQDGTIMEASISSIALLTIGEDSYVAASGQMVKVLKNTLKGAVVKSVLVDFDTMNKANIGYGTSATASTQNVSIAALSSEMDFSINKSLDTVNTDRDSGTPLSLLEVNGIYYKGMFYPATRTDILGIPGVDKDALKDYLKKEKIKLNNVDDLGKLVDYLYSLQ